MTTALVGTGVVARKGHADAGHSRDGVPDASVARCISACRRTWRGQVKEGDDTYGVETTISQLIIGQTAGRQLFSSPSPWRGDWAWCAGPIVLKERRPDGAFVFTKATDRGSCGDDEFRARLVDDDHLVFEWFWSRGDKPDASATLERKR